VGFSDSTVKEVDLFSNLPRDDSHPPQNPMSKGNPLVKVLMLRSLQHLSERCLNLLKRCDSSVLNNVLSEF
jgi:hypothetical protein